MVEHRLRARLPELPKPFQCVRRHRLAAGARRGRRGSPPRRLGGEAGELALPLLSAASGAVELDLQAR